MKRTSIASQSVAMKRPRGQIALMDKLGVPVPKRVRSVPQRHLTMFVNIKRHAYTAEDWHRDLARLNEHGTSLR